MNVIKIDISKTMMVGDFQRFILHTDLTRIFYNEIFEHESHELNE